MRSARTYYLRDALVGEAVLTVGGPVHEWRRGHIDGVVSVGPHECMPNKLAEAHFFHVARREGLLSLSLQLNGDPIDPEVLDNFAYEIHAQFRQRAARGGGGASPEPARLYPVMSCSTAAPGRCSMGAAGRTPGVSAASCGCGPAPRR